MITIARADLDDRAAIEAILREAGLPLDGLEVALGTAVVAADDGRIVGCAAVEPYGDLGLLRSVAVATGHRERGVGRRLVEEAERLAVSVGVGELYLLTETAGGWFSRLGYEPIARERVPAQLTVSAEFRGACPDTAAAYRRALPVR